MTVPRDTLQALGQLLGAEFKHHPLGHLAAHADFAREKERLLRALHARQVKAEKKAALLQDKLEECRNWPAAHHEGLLLQANLFRWKPGLTQLEVEDWENENQLRSILLSPPMSGQAEVAKRFHKSRKLRLGIPHMEREVGKVQALILNLDRLQAAVNLIEEMETLLWLKALLFKPMAKSAELRGRQAEKALPYRQFWTASGHAIWVGKKAQDNEKLTFSLAHGSDYWLHVHGAAGSHVILKGFKRQDPDLDSLQDAMQLALFYSQAKKQGGGEVMVTQQKFVHRFGKGKHNVGKVQVSKFKTHWVDLDLRRVAAISQRRVE